MTTDFTMTGQGQGRVITPTSIVALKRVLSRERFLGELKHRCLQSNNPGENGVNNNPITKEESKNSRDCPIPSRHYGESEVVVVCGRDSARRSIPIIYFKATN